ncbi:hypothetical protein, partial [Pseudomonas aeruginosa]
DFVDPRILHNDLLAQEVVARAMMLNRSVEILTTKKHQCAGNQKAAAKTHKALLLTLIAQH